MISINTQELGQALHKTPERIDAQRSHRESAIMQQYHLDLQQIDDEFEVEKTPHSVAKARC